MELLDDFVMSLCCEEFALATFQFFEIQDNEILTSEQN